MWNYKMEENCEFIDKFLIFFKSFNIFLYISIITLSTIINKWYKSKNYFDVFIELLIEKECNLLFFILIFIIIFYLIRKDYLFRYKIIIIIIDNKTKSINIFIYKKYNKI